MQLLLALLGVLLAVPGAPALSLEASEETELGMASKTGEGGRGGKEWASGGDCWLSKAGEDPGPGPEEVAAGQDPTIESQWLAPSKCPSISVSIREDWPCRVQALNWAAELAVSPLAVCVGV